MKSVDTFTPPHEAAPAAPQAEGANKKRVEAGKFDALLAKAKGHEVTSKSKTAGDTQHAAPADNATSRHAGASADSKVTTHARVPMGKHEQASLELPGQARSIHDSITRTTRVLGSQDELSAAKQPATALAPTSASGADKTLGEARAAQLEDVDTLPLRFDDELQPDPAALQAVLGQVATVVARIVVPKEDSAQGVDNVAKLDAASGGKATAAVTAGAQPMDNAEQAGAPVDAVSMMAAARAARSRSTVPPGHSVPPLNAAEAASMPGLATRGQGPSTQAAADVASAKGPPSGPGAPVAADGKVADAVSSADLRVSTSGARDAARSVASARIGQSGTGTPVTAQTDALQTSATQTSTPQTSAVKGAVKAVQQGAAGQQTAVATPTSGAVSTTAPGAATAVAAPSSAGGAVQSATAPTQASAAPQPARPAVQGNTTGQTASTDTQTVASQSAAPSGTQLAASELTVEVPFQVKTAAAQPGDDAASADSKVQASKERDPMDRIEGFTRGALAGPAFSAYGARTQSGADREAMSDETRGEELEDEDSLDVQSEAKAELEKLALAPEQTLNVQAQPAPQEVQRFDAPLPAPAVPVPQAPQRMPEVEFIARPPGSQTEAATISIHHPDLGPIQLEVHRDHGRVEVHAVLESVHAEAVLRANESGIRQGVQQSGMTFSALRVRVRGEEQPTARPAQARSKRRENSPER